MHKIDGLDYVTLSEASSMFDVDGLVDRVRQGAVRFAYLKHGSSRSIVLCLTDLHSVLKSLPEPKSAWGEEKIVIDGVSRFWIGRTRVVEMLMDFGEVDDDMANIGGSAPLVMAALGPVTKYGAFLHVGLRFWHDRDQSPLDVSYGAQRGA